MNMKMPISFEKIIWPIVLISLGVFPVLYTAIVYVCVYIIDKNDPIFFDILLGTIGRLMKGIIASLNSFFSIMVLYCFFALKHKILWLFIPIAGLFAPVSIELILMYDWHTQNSSQSLLQYINQERIEIISLHLSSIISSCILYLIYKFIYRNISVK